MVFQSEVDWKYPIFGFLSRIKCFVMTCIVTDTLDGLGLDPLADLLSAQGGWPVVLDTWDPNSFNLSTALNNLRSLNVYPLVSVFINTDVFNTSKWLIFVSLSIIFMFCYCEIIFTSAYA